MQSEEIRLIIADDHHLVLEALGYSLERYQFQVVGTTHSGREAIRLVEECRPDVLILDINIPDMDGHRVLAALKDKDLPTRVLVLSSSKDPKDVALAIEYGAAGYLSKDMQPADLMEAVGRIAAGETVFDRELLDRVLSMDVERDNNNNGLIEPLTEQEYRVLILLSNGMSNPEIASVLTLSANTIKTHVHHIFGKIGVSDRTSAALWATKMGLFPPGSRIA